MCIRVIQEFAWTKQYNWYHCISIASWVMNVEVLWNKMFMSSKKKTNKNLLCRIWNLSNLNLFTHSQQMELSSVSYKNLIIKLPACNMERSWNNAYENQTRYNFTYIHHIFFVNSFILLNNDNKTLIWKEKKTEYFERC